MILKKLSKPKPSVVFDTYWKFAKKRQDIFFNRIIQNTSPWTDDTVLTKYKFTNAYRASDRVSQYLIKNVIYSGDQTPAEVLFRILLFKTFNKIETWENLKMVFGEITFKSYDFNSYNNALEEIKNSGRTIYSGAYIMTSGKSIFGYEKKHQNHLKLIELILNDHVAEKLLQANAMEAVFNQLKSYPTIGSFLAYQYAIDINYSELTSFNEMDFVVPGPGAKDGIKKCFVDLGEYSEADIIKYMADIQEKEFERLELDFQDLWGRPLQLIDCQNLFCEVDKYSRMVHPEIEGLSNRKRIKQLFNCNKNNISYWYPPKWNINHLLDKCYEQTEECLY